ncbi:MAG: DUF1156 domain-containing protein, partial [Anaerolineales bacterium]|nr:DUF1156 domain-containing protein [Anaerolineales bacterium]
MLIEEWLPARAIGVECMRENSTGLHPPPNRLHVWWARRPLTVSRAAVLGSLLPAEFDRATFERLLGFGRPGEEIVKLRQIMDSGVRLGGFGFPRAFGAPISSDVLDQVQLAVRTFWGSQALMLDPMAGGGSIPLEAARLGLNVVANEYNPVACSVLGATVDLPFRYGKDLGRKARKWATVWRERFVVRMDSFYPDEGLSVPDGYIFARTVPCPDTGRPTPLVPDWSLSRASGKPHIVAEPVAIDNETGAWTIRVRQVGRGAGQLRQAPAPTYSRGKGWSLFTRSELSGDYIKAMAQQGRMGHRLYAVITKSVKRDFRPPETRDFAALAAAEAELARLRPRWEAEGIIPTEERFKGDCDRSYVYGITTWASMFAPRQLLAAGVLVEELRRLEPEIVAAEGAEKGAAVVHLLAFVLDKMLNHNGIASKWECTRGVIKGKFDRHDFAFRATFGELAACASGAGLAWAADNVLTAYGKIAELPRAQLVEPVTVQQGSATNLWQLADGSVTAVVVDPPYADNVQYSELADFFYVWLKRTIGHQHPEWFASTLSENDEEAVVNIARNRSDPSRRGAKQARGRANREYRRLMAAAFAEMRRVLRDDGVLTVMFTHKQQSAWSRLFEALIEAGFTITATWPVMTESQHSLHQAKKNAAQSTVLLVARKRLPGAGVGYYGDAMQGEIRRAAEEAAARLAAQGLNRVDQLVGAFGPAMAVYSRYSEVRSDTGEPVPVEDAIQAAADAVVDWRIRELATRGLDEVDAESRFALLCWDVLGAQEFRFNEAMLLGRSAGMDVSELVDAGLLQKKGDNVRLLTARERRRERAITAEEQTTMFGSAGKGKKKRRQIHPGDATFWSAIDMCHAIALRAIEASVAATAET